MDRGELLKETGDLQTKGPIALQHIPTAQVTRVQQMTSDYRGKTELFVGEFTRRLTDAAALSEWLPGDNPKGLFLT